MHKARINRSLKMRPGFLEASVVQKKRETNGLGKEGRILSKSKHIIFTLLCVHYVKSLHHYMEGMNR